VVRYNADECSQEDEKEEEEGAGGKVSRGEVEKRPGRSMNTDNSIQPEEEPASSDQAERSREASAAEDHVAKMAPNIPTYQEAVKKYYLHYSDSSLVRIFPVCLRVCVSVRVCVLLFRDIW